MKLPFKSIRWRLQLWHGVLLLLVLLVFGLRFYYIVRDIYFDAIDRELWRQTVLVAAAMPDSTHRNAIFDAVGQALSHRNVLELSGTPGSQQRDATRSVIRKSMLEQMESYLHVSSEDSVKAVVTSMLASSEQASCYYVIWQPDGTILLHSGNLPGNIPKPKIDKTLGSHLRIRGDLWEQSITANDGTQLLVGCSTATVLASLDHLAFRLSLTGCVIMVFGLVGGWWMSSRTIRPIKEISATAAKIASGNLADRINLSETDSELGQLAEVLNASFDQVQKAMIQLQSALDRQIQFTADASHELRTPISVILAEANSALARERTSAEYQEGFESCRQAARRMRRLTESLLTLAQLNSNEQPSKRELCDLRIVVLETINLLRPLADERGVKILTELGGGTCIGDDEQLGQVVSNLISNAIQYNQPGGNVRIRVSADAHLTVLNVIDTGQGIAADVLPHIFDRFYRADKSRSYTDGHAGLGLAITKAIVEAHGGTINVDSESGCGSTFTVSLKRSEADVKNCNYN